MAIPTLASPKATSQALGRLYGQLKPANPPKATNIPVKRHSVMKIDVTKINALAELEEVQWTVTPAGEDEVKCKCPVHEDDNPSVSLNTAKNIWKCCAAQCAATGDIITLIGHILKVERKIVLQDMLDKYDIVEVKQINPNLIEKWHKALKDHKVLMGELRKRGITDQMIRRARLGENNNRIMIPVYDSQRRIINVRRYLPGAPGHNKMRNVRGYGRIAIYQPDQLKKYDKIILAGGELKALVAGSLMNKHDYGASSITGGEGVWDISLTKMFKDKEIFICFDVDAGGIAGAKEVASYLISVAKSVHIMHLPLDKEKYPKGDINDYVGQEKATDKDLLRVISESSEFQPVNGASKDYVAKTVELANATDPRNLQTRLSLSATISSMDTSSYLVPKSITVNCTRDQPGCGRCSIYSIEPNVNGDVLCDISGTDIGILEMVNTGRKVQANAIRDCLAIPTCKAVGFDVTDHFSVRDVRLQPEMQIYASDTKHINQAAYIVGEDVELNNPYNFTGRLHPHPRNQEAILLFNKAERSEDSLNSFEITPEISEELKGFQCSTTEKDIRVKLTDIYEDLEANVTRIFSRRALHLILDLTWHSPLFIDFDGRTEKGWMNSLIAGDSSQGKSEASLRMLEHYGVGERFECKSATVAGLLGGLQQIGNRWFVSWGVIPTHDKRLVILEEIKGAPQEVIAKLTDMRSSGIAELSKIEKRKTFARTRLIMISNPRSNRQLATYNYGIDAIQELIGSLEDVRRFDMALLMSANEVDPKQINLLQHERPQVAHRYHSEMCRRNVLWAWTRKANNIKFSVEAVTRCIEASSELCGEFSESIPLIDRGTTRLKIARMASGLAARLFSTEDGKILNVESAHVNFIVEIIRRTYGSNVFGYKDYSESQKFANQLLDPLILKKHIKATKYAKDLVNHLLHRDEITIIDIADWCECDREAATKLLSLFVRKHALTRIRRYYVKTGSFIGLLKELQSDKELKNRHGDGNGQPEKEEF